MDKDKTVIEKFKDTVKDIVDMASSASMKAMQHTPDHVAATANEQVYVPEATDAEAIPAPVSATKKPPAKKPPVRRSATMAGEKKRVVAKKAKKAKAKKTVAKKAKKALAKKAASKTKKKAVKKSNPATKPTAKKTAKKEKAKKSKR